MSQVVAGRCLCGGVRFEATLPPKWCAHCHCSMCRRAHGSGYVTWVGFAASALRLIADSTLSRYRSSAEATRSFCKTCGSSLFFESSRWPDEIHVTRASLEDDAEIAPMAHAFFDDRAPWVHVEDGLPRRGGDTGTEPL